MIGSAAPRRVRIAVDVLAAISAIALIISGAALIDRFGQTNQARKDNQHTWHAVICTIESSVIADKTVPYDKKVRFVKFYDDLLVNSVGTKPCGFRIPRRQQ